MFIRVGWKNCCSMSDLLRQYGAMLYETPLCVKLRDLIHSVTYVAILRHFTHHCKIFVLRILIWVYDSASRSKIRVMSNENKSNLFFRSRAAFLVSNIPIYNSPCSILILISIQFRLIFKQPVFIAQHKICSVVKTFPQEIIQWHRKHLPLRLSH